jgi:hypothetical protein
MPAITNDEIHIRDGHFYRRSVNEVDLGSQDALLQSLLPPSPQMLPRLLPFNNGHIHLHVAANCLTLLTEIKGLPFSTWWRLSPDGVNLLPVFSEVPDSIHISDTWMIPAHWGQMLFALNFTRRAFDPPQPANAFLYVYRSRELFKISYPNIYTDGRICMGPDWDHRRGLGKDVMSDFIQAYNTFHATVMSNHLVSNLTYLTFKRTLHGWDYPQGDAVDFLSACAPAFLQGFYL